MSSEIKLEPTLWRTCRALANEQRLRILGELILYGPRQVADIAVLFGLPETTASQYLRMINARGLLAAQRSGRFVTYRAAPNESVPESAILLEAIHVALAREHKSVNYLFKQFTAFTHPRRIRIVQCLADGELKAMDIVARASISHPALIRHLNKLMDRGYVHYNRKGQVYECSRPNEVLPKALLSLAQNAHNMM